MAVRVCGDCGVKVPMPQWQRHRQQHRNAGKSLEQRRMDTGYQRARKQVLTRYRHTCASCGRTKAQLDRVGVALHVHHRNEDPSDNRLSNLLPLCSDCHVRGGDRRWDGL